MKTKMHNEFEDLVKPLMQWLNDNHHPHVSVIVTGQNAELVEGLCSVIKPQKQHIEG